MAETSELIGSTNPDGTLKYPAKSISGNPAYERPPTQMHQLGGGRFVVLDIFPPPGFDTLAALQQIKAEVAPVIAPPPVSPEPEPVNFDALSKDEALALAAGKGMSVTSGTTGKEAIAFLKSLDAAEKADARG
jgi:hypothetical protein